MDLGFHNAGFSIKLVNEVNERFAYGYRYSREHLNIEAPELGYQIRDIREFLRDDVWNEVCQGYVIEEPWGIIGGPPCPDFSSAGKNAGGEGRYGSLTSVYFDLIRKRQPDFFVFENVKGLYLTKKHREFYDGEKEKMSIAGYSLFDGIYNALNFGVPQYRDRLLLIGLRQTSFGCDLDFQFPTLQDQLSNILCEDWPGHSVFAENSVLLPPPGINVNLSVQYWFQRNNVEAHANGAEYFIPKATTTRFNTAMEGDTSGKSFKRLHRWRYSPTAAYGNNEVHLHPYKARRISVAEALAIQSLPAGFVLPGDLPLSDKFKMIGNGVPYLMAHGLARNLYDWLNRMVGGEN